MKRYISLLLIIPLILAATVVPASATEANYGVCDLLEYGQIANVYMDNGREEVQPFVSGNSIIIPSGFTSGYFEVSWYFPGFSGYTGWTSLVSMSNISSLTDEAGLMEDSSTPYSSSVHFLSFSDTYVNSTFGDYITFGFNFVKNHSGEASIEFLNFVVKTSYDATVRTSVQIYDTIHSMTQTFSSTAASFSYDVNMNYEPTNQAGIAAGLCTIRLRPLATEGTYDFWDLNFEVTGINITSISCLQGDKVLDFDVGYTYMDASGNIIVNPDSQGAGDTLTNTYSRVWVSLRVYTKAANFIEGWPLVFINGSSTSAISDGMRWNITFYPSYVSYNVSILDPYVMWLSKIYSALHPEGAEEAADKFTDKVKEQSEQLNQMAGTMDSVHKPALDSVQSDISAIVPQGDMVLATAPLGTLLGNEIIVTIFSISLLFVMVSYILFGKKG